MILTEQQSMIRSMARQFARERLQPHAAKWDRDNYFPKEALAEMGQLGLLGMCIPEEWGGAGADSLSLAVALEEIAAGDAACGCKRSRANWRAMLRIIDCCSVRIILSLPDGQ